MNKLFSLESTFLPSLLVGIITILTTLAALMGSMWGSRSTSYYARSLSSLSEANTTYIEYVQGGVDEAEAEKIAKEYEIIWDQSKAEMEEAERSNNTNDAFLLVTLIFSIGIFFFSMSLSSEVISVKRFFFTFGCIASLAGIAYLSTLPIPWGLEDPVIEISEEESGPISDS